MSVYCDDVHYRSAARVARGRINVSVVRRGETALLGSEYEPAAFVRS